MLALKNKCNKLLLLSFLIIGIYSCSNDDENSMEGYLPVSEIFDISYGEHSDQVYDIYLPAGRTKTITKTFFLIHGGAWVSGDKSEFNELILNLKLNFPNYAIVNINYRLADILNSPFPMQINDIQSVLDHLKNNSDNYRIRQKYAFLGLSSGAHLSMLYAYNHDSNSVVEMVCSIVGPTNFTDPNYINNPEYSETILAVQLLTGQNIVSNPTYFENLSPLHVVSASAPPTILFYGGQDPLIPTSQGIDLNNKLNDLNVEHEFTLYENEGHGWSGVNGLDTAQKLMIFIQKHF